MKRIAKAVLHRTVFDERGGSEKETLQELEAMLREQTMSAKERVAVEEALKTSRSGGTRAKRAELKSARVVGVTGASASRDILAGQEFDIVIVDEATQMTEPAAVAPLALFSARAVVCTAGGGWDLIGPGSCRGPPAAPPDHLRTK